MSGSPKFLHVNIIARDWKRLAEFYERVFGCTPVPPERDLSGQWIEDLTGVTGASIHGVHLRLPGLGNEGPTLEILQYSQEVERREPAINEPGYAHIALEVECIDFVRNAVTEEGGKLAGKMVTREIPGVRKVTLVYVRDPEGNLIELLQR
jgi:catechol 2,3-dioxygenase-like lactoylglutathione lyase family enzyme